MKILRLLYGDFKNKNKGVSFGGIIKCVDEYMIEMSNVKYEVSAIKDNIKNVQRNRLSFEKRLDNYKEVECILQDLIDNQIIILEKNKFKLSEDISTELLEYFDENFQESCINEPIKKKLISTFPYWILSIIVIFILIF